jgi:hypothetical protein
MKPFGHAFRCLLVALAAMGVLASPVTAHIVAGCKYDGVKATEHHPDCCCGDICHCKDCPGADSSEHTPPPTPAAPDEGRVVVKAQSMTLLSVVDVAHVPVHSIAGDLLLLETANSAHSLLAQHTCLRV